MSSKTAMTVLRDAYMIAKTMAAFACETDSYPIRLCANNFRNNIALNRHHSYEVTLLFGNPLDLYRSEDDFVISIRRLIYVDGVKHYKPRIVANDINDQKGINETLNMVITTMIGALEQEMGDLKIHWAHAERDPDIIPLVLPEDVYLSGG